MGLLCRVTKNFNISRAETAVAYLLAWESEVNSYDSNGLTPLHLAVKSSEEIKSTRSIRHLLIKGAQREVKDKLGRTPLDMAYLYSNRELLLEVVRYLVRLDFNF